MRACVYVFFIEFSAEIEIYRISMKWGVVVENVGWYALKSQSQQCCNLTEASAQIYSNILPLVGIESTADECITVVELES